MPALTMRGRYLVREYWMDSDLFLKLSADERECYQGLWMLADDEGWLPRDVPGIAAAIYHYFDSRAQREAWVRDVLERLREIGKVQSHRCCLFVPAVKNWPRPGRKSDEHFKAHQTHSKGNEEIKGDLPLPDPTSPVPSFPNPAGAGAQVRPGPQSLGEWMAANGFEPPAPPRLVHSRPFSKAEQLGKAKAR